QKTFALNLHQIVLADRELQDNRVGPAEKLLDDCPDELREWEWRYRKRLCNEDLLTVSTPHVARLSLDGRRLAHYAVGSFFKIRDIRTNQEIGSFKKEVRSGPIPAKGLPNYSLAFSPDGGRLAVANDLAAVWVFDVVTGREVLVVGGVKPK